jgi:hypothetical protein
VAVSFIGGGNRTTWRKPRITVLQNILHMSKDSYFEDTKGVIRIHKSKDRQHTGQNKKDKQRSTKHYTEKTKDRATQTPLKIRGLHRINSHDHQN